MNKYSKSIEQFLTFIRESEQQYKMAEADELEANDITQDILHSLELQEHDYHEYAKLSKQLRDVRKQRRTAKDTVMALEPVVRWMDNNRDIIKNMEQLLGNVRKAEKRTENRIYTPRSGG